MIQWAPKGSYRLLNVLEYLRWAIGKGHAVPDLPAASPSPAGEAAACAGPASQRQLVVVLDWFAPHLDPQVDEELHKSGVAVLRIAGGLTNDVQVCDTHRHGPLTGAYRQLEAQDSEMQLRRKPTLPMPTFSRQSATDRSIRAWAQTSLGLDGRQEMDP